MVTTLSPASLAKKTRRKWPWVLGGIVGLLVIVGIATSGSDSPPPKVAAPEDKLATALSSVLGDSNRNVARISRASVDNDGTVEVRWSINDNVTPDLAKESARQDVVNIVMSVKQTVADPKQLIIMGDFAVPDGHGHTVERPVIGATYGGLTLAKINPAGMRSDQILRMADSAELDPAFR